MSSAVGTLPIVRFDRMIDLTSSGGALQVLHAGQTIRFDVRVDLVAQPRQEVRG